MISNSVFDRVVGRAQASKRALERLDNQLLGAQNDAKTARLGLCFAVRRPNTKTLIFDDPLTRNRVLSGPGGSQNQSKIGPESFLALELAPRASWRPLGLDFGTLWVSQNGPQKESGKQAEI